MDQVESGNAIVTLKGMLLNVKEQFLERVADFIIAIIVMAVFWLVAKLVRKIIRDVAPRVKADTVGVLLVARLVYAAIIVLGLVMALGTAGVNWTALATSLGLTGFALSFALKDAISNFLSGVLILFYRPFKIGDRVKAGNITGVVSEIRVRDTIIIDENGLKTIIPNSNVFNSIIVNYTESTTQGGPVSTDSQ